MPLPLRDKLTLFWNLCHSPRVKLVPILIYIEHFDFHQELLDFPQILLGPFLNTLPHLILRNKILNKENE